MLKNILNLKGAQQLSKKEQNLINGGSGDCQTEFQCMSQCINGECRSFPLPMSPSGVECWECYEEGGGNQ